MNRIVRYHAVALVLAGVAACAAAGTQSPPAAQAAPAAAASAAKAGVSGAWAGTLTDPQGIAHEIELMLAADGDTLTGTLQGGPPDGSSQSIRNGKVNGNKLAFEIVFKGMQGEDVVLLFEGTVHDNRIRGVHGMARMPMDLVWEATRK